MEHKKTSIIILTHNNLGYTQMCIDSLRKHTPADSYEVIIVDNASTDGSVEWLKKQENIRTIFNKEDAGYSKGRNQGIEMAQCDSILFLNSDTIVTPSLLVNLHNCLYSSNYIGAVGAVSNHSPYYQSVSAKYTNIDEMADFAANFNVSDLQKWEERLKLAGFCMLVKKEALEKAGSLDEKFSHPDFSDDDLSFRIKKAGYRLMLCKDTFIHSFGSIPLNEARNPSSDIYRLNQKIFEEKWGFIPSYSTFIRQEIINLMDMPNSEKITVLEVGCACGATLLKIRNSYKDAELHGIELNCGAAYIAKTVATVTAQNIESGDLDFKEDYFDYIIFADVLEHLTEPWYVLKRMKKFLKPDGRVLASIPNVMHFSVLRNLINGSWTYEEAGILDRTHLRFFTLDEIKKMFNEAGFKNVLFMANVTPKKEEDKEFINNLTKLSKPELAGQYDAYQYIIKASAY